MKTNNSKELFMLLDGVTVDSMLLDYEGLETCDARQRYQQAAARTMLLKHARKIRDYKTKPTFFVRDFSSMKETPVNIPQGKSQHYLSDEEKEFIRENCSSLSVKTISNKLNIKSSTVYNYLFENNLSCKRLRQFDPVIANSAAPKPKFVRPPAEYSNRSPMGIASGHNQ